jgi:hypothetical protein
MVCSTHQNNSNFESTIDLEELSIMNQLYSILRYSLTEGAMTRVICQIISNTKRHGLDMAYCYSYRVKIYQKIYYTTNFFISSKSDRLLNHLLGYKNRKIHYSGVQLHEKNIILKKEFDEPPTFSYSNRQAKKSMWYNPH